MKYENIFQSNDIEKIKEYVELPPALLLTQMPIMGSLKLIPKDKIKKKKKKNNKKEV